MSTDHFETATGARVPAVTAEQMGRVDQVAIAGPGPTLLQMMENAGRALAETVISHLDDGSVVVLAGSGGNGGGGICAARHLSNRGFDVTVVVAASGPLGAAASQQMAVFGETGGTETDPSMLGRLEAAIVVDAMIGYSLRGEPTETIARCIDWANEQHAPVIALDVPSGLDATTGGTPGRAVAAGTTLTLALPKTGLDAPNVGELWLADIGIPVGVFRRAGIELPPGLLGGADRIRLTIPDDGH